VHRNNAVGCCEPFRNTCPESNALQLHLRNAAAGFGSSIVEDLDALSHAVVNPVSIKSILRKEQLRVTVSDEAIRDPHSNYMNLVLQTVLLE